MASVLLTRYDPTRGRSNERNHHREMDQNEDFSAWYWELLELEEEPAVRPEADQHYLILSNEIGTG